MKPYNRTTYLNPLLKLSTAAVAAMLTVSCSLIGPKPEPITEQEACVRLHGLIADHPEKFIHYRKNKRVLRTLNTWTGTKVFPMANNCQVWEWSTGLYSYICNWKSEGGMEVAKSDYTEGKRIMRTCLNEDWQSISKETKNGGEYTLFSKPKSKTFVEIRYFKEPRSIFDDWHTTVIISDKSNLKAKLQ